ncbi:MAG: ABC transporter permease [Bacteroidaceae bacterium]|nr:ABC transporter permease [Bacteroidaceae bacterium]
MFNSDYWSEIWQTIMEQRTRSLMTAFGVFWGIFILTVMIGAGMGLNNGVVNSVTNVPANLLFMAPDQTSLPYKGMESGRKWYLKTGFEEKIKQELQGDVDYISSVSLAGLQEVKHGEKVFLYDVVGLSPEYHSASPMKILKGRFINEIDMREQRMVCLLGQNVATALFDNYDQALGNTVEVNGMMLEVVGIVRKSNNSIYAGFDLSASVLMPLPTELATYGKQGDLDLCMVAFHQRKPIQQLASKAVALVKEEYSIHPDDTMALYSYTTEEMINQYGGLFSGINILIWIVGLGTLLAGLIGISNIMLISVKERKLEIGVRRALGALPSTILRQIMTESLVLTSISGFTGLCLGVILLQIVNNMIGNVENDTFYHPYMPFWAAVISLLILIAGGLFAGWLPARNALKIKAIDALREE